MQLTKHFTYREATHSATAAAKGIDNTPTPAHRANILTTAQHMEAVRALLGAPIVVSSWYRSAALNRVLAGSSTTSAHLDGLAVDFTCPKYGSTTAVCQAIAASAIPFDQLIWEQNSSGTRWVHIGFAKPGAKPRRQLLTKRPGQPYIAGIPK